MTPAAAERAGADLCARTRLRTSMFLALWVVCSLVSQSAYAALGDPSIPARLSTVTYYRCQGDDTTRSTTPQGACQYFVDRFNASSQAHGTAQGWDCSYTTMTIVNWTSIRSITGLGVVYPYGDPRPGVLVDVTTDVPYISPCYPGEHTIAHTGYWYDTVDVLEYSCQFEPHSALSGSVCVCLPGFSSNMAGTQCIANHDTVSTSPPPSACNQVSNPIVPLTGTKVERQEVSSGIGGIPLVLTYDSSRTPALAPGLTMASLDMRDPLAFGPLWLSSLHRKLVLGQPGRNGALSILALRGDGSISSFASSNNAIVPAPSVRDTLSAVPGGYRHVDSARRAVESYDALGTLTRITTREGTVIDFTYSDESTPASVALMPGLLIRAQDSFGRVISFTYATVNGTPHVWQ